MKLHAIRLCNLNSLYGEQSLDLEEDLDGAPLFLIMGPTGSGKSTLMDAVSLALFGATPRLGDQSSSKQESDARQTLSRGCGQGWAEVEFSKREQAGRRFYRARWSVRRAHRRPDGNLQTPERSLEELQPDGSWKILISDHRRKNYAPVFEAVLDGFTALDFQRSMLLAQGQFAAFLEADEDQRADILERLTDTGIYKRLGFKAAMLRRRAQSQVELAKARLQGIHLLEDDELAQLRARKEALVEELAQLQSQQTFLDVRVRFLTDLDALTQLRAQAEALQLRARLRQWRMDPQLARLRAHRGVATALPSIRALDKANQERDRALQAQRELLQEQAEVGPQLEKARNDQSVASAEVSEARALLASRLPAIELALERQKLCRKAEERLELADGELERLVQRQQTVEETRAAAASLLEQARTLAQERSSALEHGAVDEALDQQLPQLRADVQTVRRLRDALDEVRSERQRLAKRVQELGEAHQKAIQTLEASELALLPLAETREQARQALVQAQAGQDSPTAARQEFRRRRDRLLGQQKGLAELLQAVDRLKKGQAQLSELTTKVASYNRQRRRWTKSHAELESQLAETRSRLEQLAEDERVLGRRRTYSADRAELVAGTPCPLCGATEHPLTADHEQAVVDAHLAREHQLVREQHQECTKQLSLQQERLNNELARWYEVRGQGESDQQQLDPLREQVARFESQVQQLLGQLDLDQVPHAMEAELQQRRCTEALEQLTLQEGVLESAERHANGYEKAHDAAAHRRDLHQAHLEAEQGRLEEARAQLVQADEDFQGAHDLLRLQGNQVRERFTSLGVEAEHLDEALAEAEARVERWRGLSTSLAAAEQQVAKATTEVERVSSVGQELDRQLAERREGREAIALEVDEARAALTVALGALEGQEPQPLLDGLEKALGSAEAALVTANKRFHELEARVKELAGKNSERSERATQTKRDARLAQRALEDDLESLGLGSVDEVLARTLPEDELQHLLRLEAELVEDVRREDSLANQRDNDVQARLARIPEHLDPERADRALLEELAEALGARCRELDRQTGVKGQQVEHQERLRKEQEEQLAALREARERSDLWGRMHELIGRGDGDEFKRFAQALNLGELLQRANQHLERLAARYRLEPARTEEGLPRLVFEVIDAWQDDARRPLSTLSGGETFLVSLALALALAEARGTRMPIETLLLDEGFGTLDPETLNVALGALQHLLSTGTQVGIISHVAGLQERIDARVVVEPLGSGRSRVRCELGP